MAALAAAFRARRGDGGRSTPPVGGRAEGAEQPLLDAEKFGEIVAMLDSQEADALVGTFGENVRADLSALDLAIRAGDLHQASRLAHPTRGLCLVMGAAALAMRLRGLEMGVEIDDRERARTLCDGAPACLNETLRVMRAAQAG